MKENREIKSRRTKKIYRYTAQEVAALCKCSVSYVKKIRSGHVDTTSHKAQQVLTIDDTLYDGSTRLLKEVERILNS